MVHVPAARPSVLHGVETQSTRGAWARWWQGMLPSSDTALSLQFRQPHLLYISRFIWFCLKETSDILPCNFMRCLRMCCLPSLSRKNSPEGTRLSNTIHFPQNIQRKPSMGPDTENNSGAHQPAGQVQVQISGHKPSQRRIGQGKG